MGLKLQTKTKIMRCDSGGGCENDGIYRGRRSCEYLPRVEDLYGTAQLWEGLKVSGHQHLWELNILLDMYITRTIV